MEAKGRSLCCADADIRPTPSRRCYDDTDDGSKRPRQVLRGGRVALRQTAEVSAAPTPISVRRQPTMPRRGRGRVREATTMPAAEVYGVTRDALSKKTCNDCTEVHGSQ